MLSLYNHVCHLLWHRIGRPTRGSQRDLRIVGWDLRIIGYVRHGVWRQTKVLSKQRVLGHDAQLPAITYNHFGTYIHMYHGSGNDFTDLRIYPPPSPSSQAPSRRASANQVTAGRSERSETRTRSRDSDRISVRDSGPSPSLGAESERRSFGPVRLLVPTPSLLGIE